jgi:AcrR family transcriptional regulator
MYESRDAVKRMRDSKPESVGFKAGSRVSKKSANSTTNKQERALLTRAQLVDSARTIFARDGFETARIEDIASMSGKTRGAFYANFKDKEDVFFAIFEQDITLDQQRLRTLIKGFATPEQKLDALAAYLGELIHDQRRALLYLEFKAYAIRHPKRRKRLADLHALMRDRCSLPEIREFLPEVKQTAAEHRSGSLAITAVVDGLALNRLFDPEALDDARIATYLRLCIREALPIDHAPKKKKAHAAS